MKLTTKPNIPTLQTSPNVQPPKRKSAAVKNIGATLAMLALFFASALPSAKAALLLTDISQITTPFAVAGWTFGNVFVVGSSNISVTRLGYIDVGLNGLTDSHAVSLWNSTGTMLGTVTVQSGTASTLQANWRWENLSSPLTLSAGQTYRVGGTTTAADAFTYANAGNVTVPNSVGGVLGGAGVLLSAASGDGRFIANPNTAPTSGWWVTSAANLDFTVVPEPSTWAMLAFGLTTLTIFRRRRSA